MNILSFIDFGLLLEAEANTHSTHIEDLIFTQGAKGVSKALGGLLYIKKTIGTNKQSAVTVKIDGAPAVCAGYLDGKFFVASKGLFAKTPKINYTEEDIDRNHQGGIVDKLKTALKYLPDVIPKGKIYQGDFLFDKSSLTSEKIDGEDCWTWHPNTIKYAVTKDSKTGKQIAQAKIGIVFHTEYQITGEPIPENIKLKGFGVKQSGLKPSKDVWYIDAYHKNYGALTSFTEAESKDIASNVKEVQSLLQKIQWKYIAALQIELMTYTNTFIRNNQASPAPKSKAAQFIDYIEKKASADIASKRTEKGKSVASERWQPIILTAREAYKSKTLEHVFLAHALLYKLKLTVLRKLDSIKSTKTFLERSDGSLVVTGEEGFVLTNTSAKGTKLVDRYEFSKANFSPEYVKGWSH